MRDYEEKSYYEIQLDNKQLILVFLAAVTVCVLIFVLGVMIGKGQKEAELAAGKTEPAAQVQPEKELQPPSEPLSQSENEQSEPQTPKGESPAEPKSATEELQSTEEKTAEIPEMTGESEKQASVPGPVPAAVETTPQEQQEEQAEVKKKTAYTVQVIATSSKAKAEEQLSLLKAKGHSPQLDAQKIGSGTVYKVRVGRFDDSSEAKALAARLKNELHVDTWVAVIE